MAGNHFMGVGAAAKLAGLSPGVVYAWVKKGNIPSEQFPGKVIRVSLDDVRTFRKTGKPLVQKSLEAQEVVEEEPPTPSDNPLLSSWWKRTVEPLLESQGIRGIAWKAGGPLEVEVVTRVKL